MISPTPARARAMTRRSGLGIEDSGRVLFAIFTYAVVRILRAASGQYIAITSKSTPFCAKRSNRSAGKFEPSRLPSESADRQSLRHVFCSAAARWLSHCFALASSFVSAQDSTDLCGTMLPHCVTRMHHEARAHPTMRPAAEAVEPPPTLGGGVAGVRSCPTGP
jgi:hypothetical protein